MRVDVIGLDGDRLAQAFKRGLVLSHRGEGGAAIVMGLGIFGFQLDGLVEAFDRFGVALERIEHEAVVQQHLRRLAGLHRRAHQVQGFRSLALGEFDQAHHLQRVEMVGAGGENGGVELFGLRQMASLMELQRLSERLRYVQRCGQCSSLGQRNLRHFHP